jgi:hypothetical protein
MSQDDTPNLTRSEPAPPGVIDAKLAEQARNIVPWGTGWRYGRSAFSYEMAGVIHPVIVEKKVAMKKYIMAAMAGGPPTPPPGVHPALMIRGFIDLTIDYQISKIFWI